MLRRLLALVVILAAGGGLVACTRIADFVRPHTYGPRFDYIPDDQVDSVMWQLARDVKRIDTLVHDPAGVTPAQRDEIARLLVIMDDATKRLGRDGVRTNHPLIDEHREMFRSDLEVARRGVLSNPPSYALAGNISGACLRCHEHGTR